jgi:hypothetical protein
MTPDEGARLNVENHKQFFRLGIGKANMAPARDEEDWFRLISVELGNGSFGMPGDSVGVVIAWTPPDPLAGVTPDDVEKAKSVCWGKMWRADAQAAAWIGFPIARALRLNLGPKTRLIGPRTRMPRAARSQGSSPSGPRTASSPVSKLRTRSATRGPSWSFPVTTQRRSGTHDCI